MQVSPIKTMQEVQIFLQDSIGMIILAILAIRSKLDQKVILINKHKVEAIPIITCIKISLMKKIEATRHFDYSYLL